MAHDNVNGPNESADLLSAWRGQVQELQSGPVEVVDEGVELLARLRSIADDLQNGPALPQLPAGDTSAQVEVVEDAIIVADASPATSDTVLASAFDLAALNAAIAALEGAANTVLSRAEGELSQARDAVQAEAVTIRDTLSAELKALREEINRSNRRGARRSGDSAAPRVMAETNDSPVLAKLVDACTQLEALRAQTEKLSASLPQQQSSEAAPELGALQQFLQTSLSALRSDVQTYATAERKNAQSAITAAEKSIEKLQSRVSAATTDADQRLTRLTSMIQSAVERAERSAAQVQATFSATESLRAEATSAVGNWREEALRIVRDALSRMATETAGAASQAKEARKTVVAETRALRAELLKNAESAHSAVMTEIRHELAQTRATFEEQRKHLASELSALEAARHEHEASAANSRKRVDDKLTQSEELARHELQRLDSVYRDLAAHLGEVGAANGRVIETIERIEQSATSELAPVAQLLAELRQSRAELESEHAEAIRAVLAAHSAIGPETDRLRASIENLNAEAGRVGAEVAPLAEARQASEELTASARQSIGETLEAVRDAQKTLEQQHRAAIDLITDTHATLSSELRRELNHARSAFSAQRKELDSEQQRLSAAIDGVEARAQKLAAAHDDFDAARDRVGQAGDQLIAVRELVAGAASEVGVAKLELSAAKEGLAVAATEVTQAAKHAESTHATITASAQEIEREIREELEALAIARAEYESAALELRRDIGAAAEVHEEALSERRDQLAMDREQLASAVSSIGARIQELTSTLESLEAHTQAQARLVGDLSGTNEDARATIELVQAAAAELNELADHHRSALSHVTTQHDEALRGVAEEIRSATEYDSAQASAFLESLRSQVEAVADDQRAQFAALTIEYRSQLDLIASDLRAAADEQIRHAADQLREELSVVTDALREQLERATHAERDASALREAMEDKRAEDDGAALQRAVGMLSVLESLDDAVRSLQGQESADARRRIAHFEREARAMAKLVELEEIDASGAIDETLHEIVGVEASDAAAGRIVDVRQRGYAFRGRVIRPAQVVVSGASARSSRAHAASELTL